MGFDTLVESPKIRVRRRDHNGRRSNRCQSRSQDKGFLSGPKGGTWMRFKLLYYKLSPALHWSLKEWSAHIHFQARSVECRCYGMFDHN